MPDGAVMQDRPARSDQKRNLLMKPVRRNATRQIRAIKEATKRATSRESYWQYEQRLVHPDTAWDYYDRHRDAKLIDNEDGTFQILGYAGWYRLYTT